MTATFFDPFTRLPGDWPTAQREELQGLVIRVRAAKADGGVEDVDARVQEGLELCFGPRFRIRLPLVLIGEVQREHAQHVDHERPLHKVDRARRVLLRALTEKLVAAQVDHRRGNYRGAGRRSLREHAPAGNRVLVVHVSLLSAPQQRE